LSSFENELHIPFNYAIFDSIISNFFAEGDIYQLHCPYKHELSKYCQPFKAYFAFIGNFLNLILFIFLDNTKIKLIMVDPYFSYWNNMHGSDVICMK
jgi:hypothetical protein